MIIVFAAPKGGVGKTTIISQLRHYLPKDTRYLDLDYNQGLYRKLPELKQIKPEQIDLEYIDKVMEKYYDNGLLVIDCGGYMTSAVLTALAKCDKIYMPMQLGETNDDAPSKFNDILSNLEEQMDYHYKAFTFFTNVTWNTNRKNLTERLTGLANIEPLPFAISYDADIKKLKQSKKPRAINEITLLANPLARLITPGIDGG